MSLYIVPALLGLMFKLYVLLIAHNSRGSRVFYGMILIFALHNSTEVVLYIQYFEGTISDFLMRTYYAATFLMLLYMCLYSIEVSKLKSLKPYVITIAGVITVLCLIIFATDFIVAGILPIKYAVTAARGPYYWLFSVTSLTLLALVTCSLVYGYKSATSHRVQVRCLYTLMAMSPIVLLGIILIPLMSLGVKVNAAGILPICTTLFLLITLQSESKHRLSDIRRFLPFSHEKRTARQVLDLISRYSMDEISYKELATEFEKIVVLHKFDKAGQSVSEAAKLMQINRTTLYSIVNRHGISKDKKSSTG